MSSTCPRPRAGDDVRAIVLRPEEYRRLAAFIRASFATAPAHLPGYGGVRRLLRGARPLQRGATCNAWTGDALRYAGVRVGAWTPFPATVLWWF